MWVLLIVLCYLVLWNICYNSIVQIKCDIQLKKWFVIYFYFVVLKIWEEYSLWYTLFRHFINPNVILDFSLRNSFFRAVLATATVGTLAVCAGAGTSWAAAAVCEWHGETKHCISTSCPPLTVWHSDLPVVCDGVWERDLQSELSWHCSALLHKRLLYRSSALT